MTKQEDVKKIISLDITSGQDEFSILGGESV